MAGLLFSLKTHRDLFNPHHDDPDDEVEPWTTKKSVTVLAIAGVLVGIMSEVLVGSIEEASKQIGLSQFFVGLFIVAIVGNAAEHWVAVLVARKDKMDLSINIAVGSSAQIALFVAPLLVLLSFVFGPHPMALVFNGYELGGLIFAVADRELRDPGRRVELVRGRPAPVRLRRDGARLLLRLTLRNRSKLPGLASW